MYSISLFHWRRDSKKVNYCHQLRLLLSQDNVLYPLSKLSSSFQWILCHNLSHIFAHCWKSVPGYLVKGFRNYQLDGLNLHIIPSHSHFNLIWLLNPYLSGAKAIKVPFYVNSVSETWVNNLQDWQLLTKSHFLIPWRAPLTCRCGWVYLRGKLVSELQAQIQTIFDIQL